MPAAVSPPAPSSRGDLWYDAGSIGVLPGSAAGLAAANSAAIEAWMDAVAPPPGRYAVLGLPTNRASYPFARPINPDRGWLAFVCPDGTATLSVPGRTDPVFALGYGRRPRGRVLTAAHFVDLYGRLDTSAAAAAGRRWGYRTLGDSHLAQGSGPFAFGPVPATGPLGHWATVRRLTLEVAIDTTATGAPSGPVADLGRVYSWWVDPATGRWWLWLFGPEDTPGHQPTHKVSFLVPAALGVHRVAVQVDLDGPHSAAYVDGVQVATIEAWAAVPGGGKPTLAEDSGQPYLIASYGGTALGAPAWPGANLDLCVLGHATYAALRYADPGAGQAQHRLDGGTLNDAYRYFAESDPNLIALLRLQDPPAAAANRLLTVVAGPSPAARGSSMFALSADHDALIGLGPYRLKNLVIQGDQAGTYGGGVLIGAAGSCELDRCDVRAGARAIDCWGAPANYLHRARDCSLWGNSDSALYAVNALWDVRDVAVPVLGRNTVWTVNTRIRIRGMFTGDAQPGLRRVFYVTGSDIGVEDANIDIEGAAGPSRCVGELRTYSAEGGKLTVSRVRDLILGALPAGIPLFILNRGDANNLRARFDLSGLVMVGDDKQAIVRVDSTGWCGTVDVDYTGATPAILETAGPSGVIRTGPFA
jgi:hypothetical protein